MFFCTIIIHCIRCLSHCVFKIPSQQFCFNCRDICKCWSKRTTGTVTVKCLWKVGKPEKVQIQRISKTTPTLFSRGTFSDVIIHYNLPEVGSAICFSGPQYAIPQFCFRSPQNAITQVFQIFQCAMRNSAIADSSATHNHSKEKEGNSCCGPTNCLLWFLTLKLDLPPAE